jgi:hypothetical protein
VWFAKCGFERITFRMSYRDIPVRFCFSEYEISISRSILLLHYSLDKARTLKAERQRGDASGPPYLALKPRSALLRKQNTKKVLRPSWRCCLRLRRSGSC